MSSSDPLFRFYFDGEETPRFSLHLSEFGEKEPFIKPLAESYIGPFDNGRGPYVLHGVLFQCRLTRAAV